MDIDIQDQKNSEEKDSSLEKKPGVNFMHFGLNNFYAFFISSIIGSVAIDYIGLPLSLILSGILIPLLYILLNQVTLRAAITNGSLKEIGKSKLGLTIFKIEDELANALAVGFSKHFGYIIATTGLSKILNKTEFTEIMNHENNHIQQMHNLTLILPGILTIIVLLSVIEIAITNIFILIFGYILIMGGGIILLLTLSRNIETLADVTSDSAELRSALMKMEEHNRQLRETKNTSKKPQNILFRTHPPTSERPKEPSKIKHILIAGFYFSFLIIIGIVIRIILNSNFSGFFLVSIIFIFLGGIVVGSAIFAFDYFLITYLIKIISKRFAVNSFNSINVLNGIMVFFIISVISILTGVSNQSVILVFMIGGLPFAIIITALEIIPFKKGIVFSTVIWIINLLILTGIYAIFFPIFG